MKIRFLTMSIFRGFLGLFHKKKHIKSGDSNYCF